MKTKVFASAISNLHAMMQLIHKEAEGQKFSIQDIRKMQLAVEEAVVNIIHHSYGSTDGKITLFVDVSSEVIVVAIHDEGKPFNPLEKQNPVDSRLPLEERDEGGLGIYLIQKSVDAVKYQRIDNRNILTLTKKRSH